jgi:hypothetical protein
LRNLFCGHDSGTFIIKYCKNIFAKSNWNVSGQKLLKAIIRISVLEKSTMVSFRNNSLDSSARLLNWMLKAEYKGVLGYSWIMNYSRQNKVTVYDKKGKKMPA